MILNKRCCGWAILFAMCTFEADAQSAFTGTWSAGGQNAATLVLKVEGSRVAGTVEDREIYDGRADGDTVTFTVTSADGERTITFTGTIDGDGIAFARHVQVRDGGSPGTQGIFSLSAPLRFSARRVVWTAGTQFAAAVNSVVHDVKGEGVLFLPQKAGRVRALMIVIGWGLGFDA